MRLKFPIWLGYHAESEAIRLVCRLGATSTPGLDSITRTNCSRKCSSLIFPTLCILPVHFALSLEVVSWASSTHRFLPFPTIMVCGCVSFSVAQGTGFWSVRATGNNVAGSLLFLLVAVWPTVSIVPFSSRLFSVMMHILEMVAPVRWVAASLLLCLCFLLPSLDGMASPSMLSYASLSNTLFYLVSFLLFSNQFRILELGS